jgi:hypothetical protein
VKAIVVLQNEQPYILQILYIGEIVEYPYKPLEKDYLLPIDT